MKRFRCQPAGRAGYLLFEVIIAITIFSLSFVGLMRVLKQSQDSATQFALEAHIRYGLEAILTEVRNRPIEEMVQEQTDTLLGVVYHTEVEPLALATEEGTPLSDLYLLRARATYERGGRAEEDVAEIWIYRPQQETNSK